MSLYPTKGGGQREVLSGDLRPALIVYSGEAKNKISIYIVRSTFSKIITIKRKIRQILKRSVVNFEK
jgi:hypothetical protein